MGQVVHQLHFGVFLSPNENSHVKVLNIAQHYLGVVHMGSKT